MHVFFSPRNENRAPSRRRFLRLAMACGAALLGAWRRSVLPEAAAFSGPTRIRYAKGFSIEYHDTHKVVRLFSPWRNAGQTFTYVLAKPGSALPPLPPGAVVIPMPIRRAAATTTICLPFFAMLHVESSLVGVSGAGRVCTPEIAERIRGGQIAEIGTGNGMLTLLDMERLYSLQPDFVMVYGTGIPEFDLHSKLMEAGFKTVIFSNHMESTPLGRAEWIKFLAAFFDKEAEADRLFEEIAARYEALAEKARAVSARPVVFSGLYYRSLWYVPGGQSYAAKFIADAGGDYVWKEDRSAGSQSLDMETVVERARNADYWLDPWPSGSLAELAAADDRFGLFKAFRNGNVYSGDAGTNENGGNDFWETGVARPDLVLADLIAIFHPELMPSHRSRWYRRLPSDAGGGK